MASKILTTASLGLNSFLVEVEADIQRALPKMTIVGLADTAVQEAKERVKSAIKNSYLDYPRTSIVVNLAPADLKKIGNHYDLPIALSILQENETIKCEEVLKKSIFVGELSFDGSLRKINNIISICIFAKENRYENIFLPYENSVEASLINGINIFAIKNLSELVKFLNRKIQLEKVKNLKTLEKISEYENHEYNFSLIRGQEYAKRAMIISASGAHNVSMCGSPGSGKTLLARSMPSILPDLSEREILEVSRIYSSVGLLSRENPLITKRPFRSPHHSSSLVSLVGGGGIPKPGEITLAHRGILFLDELPEFPKKNLETLRQPLEDGHITISRAQMSLEFPAKFILITAQNPCPCGYLRDETKNCTCTNLQIRNYNQKISGPLLDRIDIHLNISRVKQDELQKDSETTNLSEIKNKIKVARKIQESRFKNEKIFTNSEMGLSLIKKYCIIPIEAKKLLSIAIEKYNLSARGYFRILKVARTIADLENSQNIKTEHIAEALQYRKMEI
ncbi:MAG TPA: YifB family Mg chelatase-like AAA ATPase [bacterium]|jgi:magnesium chelatase family protein|nr:YifB family Mg chelatase-like AAA ATPase [bacterium]HOG38128.1 YifB family Mg chelatase-like AAA ATPase [bacterium]HQI03184.1 YifB family Mg chelatase-like AAA ATPase [bacterium]